MLLEWERRFPGELHVETRGKGRHHLAMVVVGMETC